jgi:hypothetical protein
MEEKWQVIGIVKRKSKTGATYTTLHLIGQHDQYSVDNAEVCQGNRVIAETTSATLPPVNIGDEVELLYAKGFEDKAVLRSLIVSQKNPMVNNNAKK